MHRHLHPRRRHPAAAPKTFSGRTVTPTPSPTPVADVTTTSAPAAPALPLVHPLAEVIDNSVDGGARKDGFPCDGTRFKILDHRAGAFRALTGGVRFSAYTGRMTAVMGMFARAVVAGR